MKKEKLNTEVEEQKANFKSGNLETTPKVAKNVIETASYSSDALTGDSLDRTYLKKSN